MANPSVFGRSLETEFGNAHNPSNCSQISLAFAGEQSDESSCEEAPNEQHHQTIRNPGFITLLTEATNRGLATLIAEGDDAGYLPIAAVSTIAEARELARQDLVHQAKQVSAGEDTFCPTRYKVWAPGVAGYAVAAEFDCSTL